MWAGSRILRELLLVIVVTHFVHKSQVHSMRVYWSTECCDTIPGAPYAVWCACALTSGENAATAYGASVS